VNRIKVGQPLEISVVDGEAGFKHTARVIEMSPVVDPASGTIEVLAEMLGPTSDLRPGMQADVHVPTRP
jgi:multidrug efflux pump subunit AcrA (membrane-fusion protein)